MNKKFNDQLMQRPLILLLCLSTVLLIAQMVFNLANNQPLFYNTDTLIYVIGPFLVAYLASLVTTRKIWLFIICYVLSFILLLLQSIINKSFVNYTSAILTGILALLYAGLSYSVALILIKRKTQPPTRNSKK